MAEYFGKYRGTVVDHKDPDKLGRLKVRCPAVFGDQIHSWAMPCVPYAGPKPEGGKMKTGVGFYAIPPIDADIWIEFEAGDPNYPIWSGCFWNKETDLPLESVDPDTKVLRTGSLCITLVENAGKESITIEAGAPAFEKPMQLVMDKNGITLSHGTEKPEDRREFKITAELLSLINSEHCVLKLEPKELNLATEAHSVSLSEPKKLVEIRAGESTGATIADESIELKQGGSSAKIESSAVNLESGSSKANLGSGGVKLNGPKINLNDAAFEVT